MTIPVKLKSDHRGQLLHSYRADTYQVNRFQSALFLKLQMTKSSLVVCITAFTVLSRAHDANHLSHHRPRLGICHQLGPDYCQTHICLTGHPDHHPHW